MTKFLTNCRPAYRLGAAAVCGLLLANVPVSAQMQFGSDIDGVASPVPAATSAAPVAEPYERASTASFGSDEAFLLKADSGDLAEIQLSSLARMKSAAADIKELAGAIATDHASSAEQVKLLATSKDMTLPDELESDRMAELGALSGLSGPEFDLAYLRVALKDQAEAIELFSQAYRTSNDSAIRGYAQESLPTLRMHYANLRQLAATRGA